MSLFGALFSGVSGLGAQGTSMGVIADNITNISTIGYKTTQTNFKTLVTVASTASSYAPGGVQAAPQQLIDRQGLLQSSVSPTDLAINGNGFFVVNELASPTATQGSYLYSRAGSFTKDESGNLKNSAGFFLQGWPVNAATGLIPSNRSDLTELNTVNIEGIAGTASKTSTVALQANLKASQAVTATLPTDVTTLAALPPTDDLTTAPASLAAGTTIVITTGGSTVNATFTLAAAPASAATNNFNTLTELAALINSTNGLSATIGGTSTAATLTVKGPADETMTVAGTAAATLFGAASTVTAATYLASTATTNMASAAITPDFERSVAVFDSKGGSHTLTFGFLKNTPANEWLVEVYIEPSSEIDAAAANGQGLNGLIAAGTIKFGTDGSVDTSAFTTTIPTATETLTTALTVPWAATLGVAAQTVTINWGTDDTTDGLTQFDADSSLVSTTVNGAIFGDLANITVSDLGVVTAVFENGVTKAIYQLPVATFSNVAGLQARSGNAYQETDLSGTFNLNEASIGGSGLIAPSTLESSTVDLAEEFAKMIVTQRAFSAATRVITTADDMLSELIRIKG